MLPGAARLGAQQAEKRCGWTQTLNGERRFRHRSALFKFGKWIDYGTSHPRGEKFSLKGA